MEHLAAWISSRAEEAERDGQGLFQEMTRLHENGLLVACIPPAFGGSGLGLGPDTATRTFEILRRIGRASLPVARLFEGHMNAVKLVALYGSDQQKIKTFGDEVPNGAVMGVWGAEGACPVTYEEQADGSAVLHGQKAFASGLSCVSKAIITAKAGIPGSPSRLLLLDVTAQERQDASAWQANGMKATLSGVFDFEGFLAGLETFLGRAGDYEQEPHFDGGVWRYCAAHIGGAEALIQQTVDIMDARGQLNDPMQLSRIGNVIARCRAAASLVREWAFIIETAADDRGIPPQQAAAGALLARCFVSDMAIEVLQQCDRCLGTTAHMSGSAVGRVRRDLSLYIRQAAPDAKLLKATGTVLASARQTEGLW